MQKPNGWDDVEVYSNAKPKQDYYILQILNATEGYSKKGDPVLRIDLDILEGDFSGFYTSLSQKMDKNMLLQYYQLTQKKEALPFFKRIIQDVEKSNYGYTFDFNPQTLRGKKIGAYLIEQEYDTMKGKRRYLKIDKFFPVSEVREEIGKQTINNLDSSVNKKEEPQKTEQNDNYDDLPF